VSGMLLPLAPIKRLIDRFQWLVDDSPMARSDGARRFRILLAVALVISAIVLGAANIARGGMPGPGHVVILMIAAALLARTAGRFFRDWSPVFLIIMAYGAAFELARRISFPIWYRPQITVDRMLGFGNMPSVWLQQHLHASLGIEAFCVVMYLSHFFFPLVLGFYLWHFRRGEGFRELMYTDILVSVLGSVTYVLMPSAPPWMAADHGLIPGLHEILKSSLNDVGLGPLAALKGDSSAYDATAAFPSVHAALPLIGFLVIRKYRLPPWMLYLETVRLVGVWLVIVYTGEHYVVDVIGGATYAALAWLIVQWVISRHSSMDRYVGPEHEDAVVVLRVPARRLEAASADRPRVQGR
jgi:hypothetical protein